MTLREQNLETTKLLLGGKPFALSYSGGKDSSLALCRAMQCGGIPHQLIMTYNVGVERSWFHGVPEKLIRQTEASLGIPIKLVRTAGDDYTAQFESALTSIKKEGIPFALFGDIDIPDHIEWCTERCNKVGMRAHFPLLNESREALVYEFVDSGFTAHITTIDTSRMDKKYLGQKLTRQLLSSIQSDGVDICGESGEFHSFVSDGPTFKSPVAFEFDQPIMRDQYAILPFL